MSIAELIALAAVITEFVKRSLRKFGVNIGTTGAVALSVIGSIFAVGYDVIQNDRAFELGILIVLIQVIFGSNLGYKILSSSKK